jgi:sugar lactone lactonase YvrE
MKRLCLLLTAYCLLAALGPATAAARTKWDTQVLAHVPPPGYPALSLVSADRSIYVGTFTNASGDPNGPSHLYAYSPEGLMLRDWTIKGQSPDGDNGIQVAAQDAQGKLYLLDQNPPRVIGFDPHTGTQTDYAKFFDVPSCPRKPVPWGCSDTLIDNPPEPDYAAWGPDGSLYVTDYTQALIWRVPPGGGNARIWFKDPQLDGTEFGPAGIVLMPDHRTLMLDTSAGGATSVGNATTGKLYTLPINPDGSPGKLTKLWESGPAQAPDGFAVAQSGNVYMALVGPGTNQLVEISPSGEELGRTPATPLDNQALSVPFDEPSSVQFDGSRMIVTNDAYFSGDESHWVLYDVWAGEPGAPVYVPGS